MNQQTETITPQHQIPIALEYDSIHLFESHLIGVKKKRKWGFIDGRTGKEITPYKYDTFDRHRNCGKICMGVKKNKKWGVINTITGKEIIPCVHEYDDIMDYNLGFPRIRKRGEWMDSDDQWGFRDQWRLIDLTGKEIAPCIYDEIDIRYHGPWDGCKKNGKLLTEKELHSYKLTKAKKNDKWGFIDFTGKEIISCQYEAVSYSFYHSDSDYIQLFRVKKDGKWGIIDRTEKKVVDFLYEEMEHAYKDLGVAKKGDKWGFIDQTGKEEFPFIYDEILISYYSVAGAVARIGDKWCLIDETGKEVTPFIYDEINMETLRSYEIRIQVRKGNLWGFIDRTGKEIPAFRYDKSFGNNSLKEDMINVKKDGKYGAIDLTGKEIIACQYDETLNFDNGVLEVKKDGKYGAIDITGKEIIACQYDNLSFIDGLAEIKKDGKYGVIDTTGKEIIPFKYNKIIKDDDIFMVRKGKTWGLIDKTGKVIVDCSDYYEMRKDEDLYIVKVEKRRYGAIDKTGKIIIEFRYRTLYNFNEGLSIGYDVDALDCWDAWFRDMPSKEVEFYCIDKTGDIIIDCSPYRNFLDDTKYSEEEYLHSKDKNRNQVYLYEDLLIMKDQNDKWGFIDKTGKIIIPFKYDNVECYGDSFSYVKIGNKIGLVSGHKEVIPPVYEKILEEGYGDNSCIAFKKDGKWGFINKDNLK